MIHVIGEILFDEFPNYRRLGGAPFNFAFHLIRFGETVKFISKIGDDRDGKEILDRLQDLNFPTEGIQIDPKHRTGLARIALKGAGIPEFNIMPNVAYDHISYVDILKSSPEEKIDLVYFGSVIQRTISGFENLHSYLTRFGGIKCLFDVNLRPNCLNEEAVAASVKRANILKLNCEELDFIKDTLFRFRGGSPEFIEHLFKNNPLEILVVTRGDEGSGLYLPGKSLYLNPRDNINLVDTVGAGDAYAAVIAIGYLRGWPPEKKIEAATHFASRICEIEGAVPLTQGFYSEILANYNKN